MAQTTSRRGGFVYTLYQEPLEFTGDGVYRCTFDEWRLLSANQGLVDLLRLDSQPAALAGRLLRELLISARLGRPGGADGRRDLRLGMRNGGLA